MAQLLLAVIYLSFISLGLPDSLLGAAWPTIYQQFEVPISYAGTVSMIIAAGTIVSSLQCDRLTNRLGTGKVTAISVAATAVSLFGFSISTSFWRLCLWAIPYGLGAGCVDASLNNYVALHYASRHMSWLHCMWGIGASAGPYIMGLALTGGQTWNQGYWYIAILQIVLTAILLFSLPLWKNRRGETKSNGSAKPLTLRKILRISGAKPAMVTFFCYCALEQTAGLWSASYLALHCGLSAEQAAGFAGMFYIGITVGRALCGFITLKLNDIQMTRSGFALIAIGLLILFLPFGEISALSGLVLVGFGCAPVYPCLLHATPDRFGANRSQSIIGVQMASAYVGTSLMPPLFGLLAQYIAVSLLPFYLLTLLSLMLFMHEKLLRNTATSVGKGAAGLRPQDV